MRRVYAALRLAVTASGRPRDEDDQDRGQRLEDVDERPCAERIGREVRDEREDGGGGEEERSSHGIGLMGLRAGG